MTTRIAPGVGANLLGQHSAERNQDATAYVGNLDPQVTEELLWELFVQAGPVVNVYVPKDRVTNAHQGYGFVEFRSEEDADYAIKVLNMIKLYGKPIRVNKASQDKKSVDVGANLFVGNLDPDVDEKLLYDTFSAFGVIVSNPKIMRDPETGNSRGFGFISYDSFEASDAAIEGKEELIDFVENNMAKKKATMTLKDFHGGSIPSDLPLPSAPGVVVRPSSGGFDRQTSWGNPMGRPEHRLRPGSAGATRNFDEKTPFLSHNAPIGRNFDEDERKPLDGASAPRRTIIDESIRVLPSRVEPKTVNSVTGMLGAGQVSASPSQNFRGAASGTQVARFNETTSMGVNTRPSGGSSGWSVSSPNVSTNSGQVVTGSHPNAWGLRKEVPSAKESVSAPWSAPDAESKLAHASALEKVSSGRWHSKQQLHSQIDVEVIKNQETERELFYHGSTMVNNNVYNMPDVMGRPEFSDQVLAVHAERNLGLADGVHGFSKDLPTQERARSPLFTETNERRISASVTGSQRPHNVVNSGGYESQPPASSEPSERPKLKLLPRSKPLENLGQSIDYKQVNQQPSHPNHIEKLGSTNPSPNPIKAGFVEPESGNQAIERPKLNLKPRSQPLEHSEGNTESKRKPLFGGARPRESVLKNRGFDDVAHNHDLHQPHPRSKQHAGKGETVMHATRHNEKAESISIDHRMTKNADRQDHRTDVEKGDGQRRNWRNENWRNSKETERHHHHQPQQHAQERPPSPETWRKPVEPPRPASADSSGVRYGKAASAVELAAAFSKSVSDPATTDRFSGQKSLPNRGQIPFSRLTGPPQRPQINGY